MFVLLFLLWCERLLISTKAHYAEGFLPHDNILLIPLLALLELVDIGLSGGNTHTKEIYRLQEVHLFSGLADCWLLAQQIWMPIQRLSIRQRCQTNHLMSSLTFHQWARTREIFPPSAMSGCWFLRFPSWKYFFSRKHTHKFHITRTARSRGKTWDFFHVIVSFNVCTQFGITRFPRTRRRDTHDWRLKIEFSETFKNTALVL